MELKVMTGMRCYGFHADPEAALLEIESGKARFHFIVKCADLETLGQMMINDAKLMRAKPSKIAS